MQRDGEKTREVKQTQHPGPLKTRGGSNIHTTELEPRATITRRPAIRLNL